MKLKNMIQVKQFLPACILGLMLLFTSCNKWLDVNPKTQIKEDDQFNTKQGFTDGLFGIYQTAAKQDSYGKHLSFGTLDILAQRYENKSITTSIMYKLARYNYTDSEVQRVIDSVFNNNYAAIAQANFILKNVDNGVLDDNTKAIVKGESIGMRAFLHFDLIRLFSPAYNDGANASAPSIAYVKEFKVSPTARLTVGEALALCEADLKEAEQLLSAFPYIDQIAFNQGSVNPDLFMQFRQNHLNYWAVKATLARLYQFKGDKANALKYALEVINSKQFAFINQTTLNVDATAEGSDLTFSSEHIYSAYVSRLKTTVDALFKPTTSVGEATDLWSLKTNLNAMYQTSLANYGTDIRSHIASKSLWSELSATIVYSKKLWSDNSKNVKQRLVPIIKLAEMYYIAAEAAPSIAEGTNYLNVVRVARLIPALSPAPATQALFDAEVQLEYRKEFYAEGQLWFYYKRKGVTTIPGGSVSMTNLQYTFPIPNAELEFGTPVN
ncbi:MAG: RagB/SusD family nutrient uptake outer membrane protein [Pedobacter sp.]|nr:MAG: RagB/SusD family nutrient uptake outer membrane protein [Pedobacter sp.]